MVIREQLQHEGLLSHEYPSVQVNHAIVGHGLAWQAWLVLACTAIDSRVLLEMPLQAFENLLNDLVRKVQHGGRQPDA